MCMDVNMYLQVYLNALEDRVLALILICFSYI